MRRIVHFLSYHNAVPITLGILFLSSGLVFAANEEARQFVSDSVYQAEQRVVSIDNSYIANKDLESFSPLVHIKNVTEDDDMYYVEYVFTTVALVDAVWQDVSQTRVMEVRKTALGEYTDLGVYVTEQLKQLVDREIAYLKEVQEIERRQLSSKVVATAYSGLVGQFIDERTEELPGYTPQVVEPEPEENPDPVAVARADKSDVPEITPRASGNATSNNDGEEEDNATPQSDDGAPVLQLLGANPARIPLKGTYSDLGVVVTSQEGSTLNLSVRLSLNGVDVNSISIDTSTTSEWTIGYAATDQEDRTGYAVRKVVVYDPYAVEEEEDTEENNTQATTTDGSTNESPESDDAVTEDSVEIVDTDDSTQEPEQATSTDPVENEEVVDEPTDEVPEENNGEEETAATSTEDVVATSMEDVVEEEEEVFEAPEESEEVADVEDTTATSSATSTDDEV